MNIGTEQSTLSMGTQYKPYATVSVDDYIKSDFSWPKIIKSDSAYEKWRCFRRKMSVKRECMSRFYETALPTKCHFTGSFHRGSRISKLF